MYEADISFGTESNSDAVGSNVFDQRGSNFRIAHRRRRDEVFVARQIGDRLGLGAGQEHARHQAAPHIDISVALFDEHAKRRLVALPEFARSVRCLEPLELPLADLGPGDAHAIQVEILEHVDTRDERDAVIEDVDVIADTNAVDRPDALRRGILVRRKRHHLSRPLAVWLREKAELLDAA